MLNYNDAIDYLTRCADDNGIHWYAGRPWSDIETCPTCHGTNDAGHLSTPGSRYGWTSAHVAPVVYRYAKFVSRDTSERELDHLMSLAVNDSDTIEQGLREHAASVAGADIDDIVSGYLDAQLWAQHDYDRTDSDTGDGPSLDENYSRDDVSPEYVDKLTDEIAGIVADHPLAVRMYLNHRVMRHTGRNGQLVLIRDTSPAYDAAQFGHDLYLTREGHGAGFWDRGLGDLGDYLTDIAKWSGAADDLSDNGSGVLA